MNIKASQKTFTQATSTAVSGVFSAQLGNVLYWYSFLRVGILPCPLCYVKQRFSQPRCAILWICLFEWLLNSFRFYLLPFRKFQVRLGVDYLGFEGGGLVTRISKLCLAVTFRWNLSVRLFFLHRIVPLQGYLFINLPCRIPVLKLFLINIRLHGSRSFQNSV